MFDEILPFLTAAFDGLFWMGNNTLLSLYFFLTGSIVSGIDVLSKVARSENVIKFKNNLHWLIGCRWSLGVSVAHSPLLLGCYIFVVLLSICLLFLSLSFHRSVCCEVMLANLFADMGSYLPTPVVPAISCNHFSCMIRNLPTVSSNLMDPMSNFTCSYITIIYGDSYLILPKIVGPKTTAWVILELYPAANKIFPMIACHHSTKLL